MEDDPTGKDATVRQQVTIRGVSTAAVEDAGSAETALAVPGATPPHSSSVTTVPVSRSTGNTTIVDRYKVDRVLGQGGMGEVLLARDERIGRDVAIKQIRTTQPSAEEMSRFVREAYIQGRLEHPAIVPVHDVMFDAAGKPYFVMKRLVGTDMHERLRTLRAGDVADEASERRKLLRAFVEVCTGIEFAHQQGIIHRDLKPANIMLGEYGEVYVLDWGVAHAAGDAAEAVAAPSGRQDLALASGDTQAGTVLGTPAYMAPEQLVGDKVGPAADIYALGCILYEIASGEPLHTRARSLGAAFEPIDARPSQRRPDSPPELDQICERAVKLEATDRYPSARALGDAVQNFLDGDRDVAVRKELAQQHVRDARAALERSRDDEGRRHAMQAAGRALALDPTNSDAADLVSRLMLEPPDQVPAEVEEHLAVIDFETARSQGRLAAITVMGYLAFVPLLLWSGVREPSLVVALAALSIICSMHVFLLIRREKFTEAPIYANACINALLIAVVCRIVGPLIIAPTLVVTTLMAYSSHPRFGKIWILAVILCAAVIVPWGLELVGVLEPTFEFASGTIILKSPVIHFSSTPTQLAFGMLMVSLVGVVAVLSRVLVMRQRDATRKLELQAWQLRQIVPVVPR
jgi:serine/threonine-protein kinase